MSEDGPAERTVREDRSLTPMRKTIANRLQESYQEAVHVTVNRTIDAEELLSATDDAEKTVENVDPTVTDIILCALSDTLAAHPAFNATFEDGTHRLYEEQNVGVAITIEGGLVTPVMADIGSLSLSEMATERQRLTEKVQAGDYTMSTFKGGTFTISNLGPLGVDSFDPVINPPEIALLGLGRINEPAVAVDEDVTFRREMTASLSFDHRVVDGADAARFLETLAEHLGDASQYVPPASTEA
jgi:pyruvate/2-oxoglutarate dehydrogenase complex dihydrolipoamide acyltransferase (E2) component